MDGRDRIFKGATRPAMMLGVPIIPFILVCGVFLIVTLWGTILLGLGVGLSVLLVMVVAIAVLRQITSNDDHRLNQWLMYLRGWPYRRNNRFWRAHGLSPVDFKKRGG